MKKLKYAVLLILFIKLSSCRVCDGSIDKGFEKEFKNNLQIVIDQHKGKREILTKNFFQAFKYLGKITEHYAPVYIIDRFRYADNKSYRQDIRAWGKWYRKNKCNYTKAMTDSIMDTNN